MKKIVVLLILTVTYFEVLAQQDQDIVVIVDVSGSVRRIDDARLQAKEILKDLVVRGEFDTSKNPDWEFSTAVGNLGSIRNGNGKPLLAVNRKVFMRLAGEKATSNRPLNDRNICDNLSDFESFLDENYPQRFDDQLTYIKLAKARAAQFAIQQNTCNYLLIELTDSREDRVPSSPYSPTEQDLVDSYGVRSNIETATLGIIRYRPLSNYQIIISEVTIIGNNCTTIRPCGPVPVPPPAKNPKIVINGLSKTSSSPRELTPKDGRLRLSWQCVDCPEDVKYRVILKKVGGGQSDIALSKSNLDGKGITVNDLSPGKYEFTVSATGTLASIKSQKGFFQIKGGGGFWIFLLVVALLVLAYFIYKKISSGGSYTSSTSKRRRRKEKQEEDPFGESGEFSSADDFEF